LVSKSYKAIGGRAFRVIGGLAIPWQSTSLVCLIEKGLRYLRSILLPTMIGVGKGFSLPALRTVRAVLPHTALQSVVSTS